MPVLFCNMKGVAFFLLCAFLLSACGNTKNATDAIESPKHTKRTKPQKKQPQKQQRLSKQQRKKYAALLHTSVDNITNHKLYLFIEKWWGVKYRYGGNSKEGVDCSGFAYLLYQEVYRQTIFRSSLQLFENSKLVKRSKHLREGDFVFFATNDKERSKTSHVGIYLVNDYFVHVSTQKGVTIDRLEDKYWKERFIGGGRVRD